MSPFVVLVAALLGLASAAPQYNIPGRGFPQPAPLPRQQPAAPRQQGSESYARILKQDQDNQFDGTFNYAYETENGIASQASGVLKNPGTDQETQVIQGSYSYTAPDGTPVTINFIADEGGFRAEGAVIPTPPPIPEAIARALDYVRSLPPQPQNQQYQ